jgi:hypothetical protein
MKRPYLHGMAVIAIFLLAACNHEHSSVTGSYGSGVVSGQVVVTGMGDNSPAGIEVSVAGTGMSAMLTAEGRFAFAQVPENARLSFRRADGIDASLNVSGASTNMTIEVNGTTATHATRRRSAGPRGGSEHVSEFEGTVQSATDTQLVLLTSNQQTVTLALTATTSIRSGRTILTAAALTSGTSVHAKATKAGDAYTALAVFVQSEDDGEGDDDGSHHEGFHEYEGIVQSVADTQLVILDSHGQTDTIMLTATTVITKGSARVTAADITTGSRVHVRTMLGSDGTNTALTIVIAPGSTNDGGHGQRAEVSGTVTAVGADTLSLQTAHSGVVTLQVNSATRIRRGGSTISLGDIAAGARVEASGTRVDATTLLASSINVEDDAEDDEGDEVEVHGTVTAVGTDSLTLETSGGSQTVQVNASTRIRKGNETIALGDIHVGDDVEAEGTRVDATTLLAKNIHVEKD